MPVKPLAGQPSTKPSDRPMAMQQVAMKKATNVMPIPKIPQIPKVVAKPAGSRTKSTVRRPKTGTK